MTTIREELKWLEEEGWTIDAHDALKSALKMGSTLIGLIDELSLDIEKRLNDTHHPTYQAVVIREYPILKKVKELVG